MSVRFTANEIKSNLKFLFSAATIVAVITFVSQILLIKHEKSSEEINIELNQTEADISQYRNLIWLMHNNNNSLSSSFSSEYLEVSESYNSTRVALIKNHFPFIRAIVEGNGLKNYLDNHDHNTCVSFMEEAREFIEEFRSIKQKESVELQQQIDIINMIILGLLTAMVFFFIYTLLYAVYGK